MTSFSEVKALQQEIADLKADVVYLSGQVANGSQSADRGQGADTSELLHTAWISGLAGFALAWLVRGMRT
jgi:hypothetical protein